MGPASSAHPSLPPPPHSQPGGLSKCSFGDPLAKLGGTPPVPPEAGLAPWLRPCHHPQSHPALPWPRGAQAGASCRCPGHKDTALRDSHAAGKSPADLQRLRPRAGFRLRLAERAGGSKRCCCLRCLSGQSHPSPAAPASPAHKPLWGHGHSAIGDQGASGCQWGALETPLGGAGLGIMTGKALCRICALPYPVGSHKSKQHQGKKLKVLFRDTFDTGNWDPQHSPTAQGHLRVTQCPAAWLCHHAIGSVPC